MNIFMKKESNNFKKKAKTLLQTMIPKPTAATLLVIVGVMITGTTTSGVVSVWAANLIGTSGPNTLVGTDKDDNIVGLGGNDRISDGLGRDKVLAGNGDDRVRLEGTSEDDKEGQDVVYGESGRDNIDNRGEFGFRLIYGGTDDDTITASSGEFFGGRMYGDSGNDKISAAGDVDFDAWGGPGNDEISGSSECAIDRAFGESGNDRIISPSDFSSGGLGDDFIEFLDCGGLAYGDSGNDELRGGEARVELHGGGGDDILAGSEGPDKLFGEGNDDTLTGGADADSFSCGPGMDTITDFNPAEGDTKTLNCENF
jgi:Ca2+-binding RTX toxin-like protein